MTIHIKQAKGQKDRITTTLSVLEGQINNTKNSTKDSPNDTGEDSDITETRENNNTTKIDVCLEGVIDKIFFSEKLYCAAFEPLAIIFRNGGYFISKAYLSFL